MTKNWVSRPFQPVLDTVFDIESDFPCQNAPNLQECGGCFAPTDPVQDTLLSFRAAWNHVSVGFVFLLVRVSAVGRRAAPHGRSDGRNGRIGRAFGAGLNGLIPMFTGQ